MDREHGHRAGQCPSAAQLASAIDEIMGRQQADRLRKSGMDPATLVERASILAFQRNLEGSAVETLRAALRSADGNGQTQGMNLMLDRKGTPVFPGTRLAYCIRGEEQSGLVVGDPCFNGGMRIGGRSVANIRDEADWIQVT